MYPLYPYSPTPLGSLSLELPGHLLAILCWMLKVITELK